MLETSFSLLSKARRQDSQAWDRLVKLYRPWILRCLHQWVEPNDAEDIAQDVFEILARKLPTFEHNRRPGAFRRWLRLTVVNCLRNFRREKRTRPLVISEDELLRALDELAEAESEMARRWDVEHNRIVLAGLMDVIRPEFRPDTFRAFHRLVLDELPPGDVAVEMGLSVNAVLIAKSRMLKRLREEASDLID